MNNNEWTDGHYGGWADSFPNLNENESQTKNEQQNGWGISTRSSAAWNDTRKNQNFPDYTVTVTNKKSTEWTDGHCGGWSDSNLNENESQTKNENGWGNSAAWDDTQNYQQLPAADHTATVTNKKNASLVGRENLRNDVPSLNKNEISKSTWQKNDRTIPSLNNSDDTNTNGWRSNSKYQRFSDPVNTTHSNKTEESMHQPRQCAKTFVEAFRSKSSGPLHKPRYETNQENGHRRDYLPKMRNEIDRNGKKNWRPKYMPVLKREEDLFVPEENIHSGKHFGILNSSEMEDGICVTGGDGTGIRSVIRSFNQCKFSTSILTNIDLRFARGKPNVAVPTLVQKIFIPLVQRKKQNIMCHAQTGSGKTAAYMLPLINRIYNEKCRSLSSSTAFSPSPYVIIFSPTKELAQQLYNDARAFAVNTKVTVAHSFGEMPMFASRNEVANGCDIFISTCGRLKHFLLAQFVKLDQLKYLVLDEADRLISDRQFYATVKMLQQHKDKPKECQILMFSATYEDNVQSIARDVLGEDAFFVRVGDMNSAVDTIFQTFIKVGKYDKQDKLIEYLQSIAKLVEGPHGSFYETPKTIVFVEQKQQADRIAIALSQENFKSQSLNSDRTLQQRCEIASDFTIGKYNILVSTDVAARGMNFPRVEYVINYDLPEYQNRNTYIHRIGRTGRAGNSGIAVSFFDPEHPEDLSSVSFYINVLEMALMDVPKFLIDISNEEKQTCQRSSANAKLSF